MTNIRQYISWLAVAALLAGGVSTQTVRADSFVGEEALQYTARTTKSVDDGTQQHQNQEQQIALANSFVNESLLNRASATTNIIRLDEGWTVTAVASGDAFLSAQDIQTLGNCRVDGSLQGVGFMVCLVDEGRLKIQ